MFAEGSAEPYERTRRLIRRLATQASMLRPLFAVFVMAAGLYVTAEGARTLMS